MNFGEGLKRIAIVAYSLIAIGAAAAIGIYALAPEAQVSGFVLLAIFAGILSPLAPSRNNAKESLRPILAYLNWDDAPLMSFFIVSTYAVSSVSTYVWAVPHIAGEPRQLAIFGLILAPAIITFAVWCIITLISALFDYVFNGFRTPHE